MIFTYEQISKLNDTELIVYNYIVKNVNKVLNMNIRELALESHVSTATITRFVISSIVMVLLNLK